MKYRFTVNRYLVETFDVEIESDKRPTPKEIAAATENPHTVTVLRETVRPKK